MEKFITLPSGVRLEYVESGPRDGTPVVFLHGVTDSWHSFERVLPVLPGSIRGLAISQRGHGDSSRPETGYRFADFSRDLLEFMDALDLAAAIIVGHSMGAGVTQRFVIDHPGRVTGFVLMGAFADFDDPSLQQFVSSSIMTLTDPIDAEFAAGWQRSTLARPMDPQHFQTVVTETLKVPAFVWQQAFSGFLATKDVCDELRAVSIPAAVMWGDADTYATRHAQERLLDSITGAQFREYAGYGHAFHWEDPGMFVADLMRFVESVKPAVVERSR